VTEPRRLSAAIGAYPETAALLDGRVASPAIALDFQRLSPITKAFAPMVREARFDISEMAIATFLMARAYDKPLVLLPVVLAARFQETALLCRSDGPIKGPADLAGARIAVRAYSQTTGMWLRGSLADSHGIRAEAQRWTTFEDAHVQEYRDPPWVSRALQGQDLLGLLREGAADAVIFGNELPAEAGIRTVFPDVAAAGAAFEARHGFMPVNHLIVVRRSLAEESPATVVELLRLLREAGARVTTRAALRPALALAIRYGMDQGLLPRALTPEEAWAGLPDSIE
jgi:4,5-dihydroxyphthalate decarboxylase